MAELIFTLLSLAALFALRHEPRAALGLGGRRRPLHLEPADGPRSGHLHGPVFKVWSLLGWLVAGAPVRGELSRDQARLRGAARLSRAQGRHAHDLRDRARGARGRHRRLGCRAVLRHAGLVEAPPRQPHHPHR